MKLSALRSSLSDTRAESDPSGARMMTLGRRQTGKAPAFGAGIWRFESSRPSQHVANRCARGLRLRAHRLAARPDAASTASLAPRSALRSRYWKIETDKFERL